MPLLVLLVLFFGYFADLKIIIKRNEEKQKNKKETVAYVAQHDKDRSKG